MCPGWFDGSRQPIATPLALRDDATYLVTGGLGSVGLEIAGYLAAHGARHLVLTGRRPPSDAAQGRIDALREQHGCEFRVVAADVADAHDVARLLATVQAELPPLAGIVHAAGEIGTTPLRTLDDAEVDRVFAGKVWGAWHLSEAAADLQLDFFLSTSSIASVWGGFGQTAYGAANAFLDGLAWRLRQQGVPGISVNFGPCGGVGGHGRRRPKLVRDWISAGSGHCRLLMHWRVWPMLMAASASRHRGPDRLGPLPAALPASGEALVPGGVGA